MKYAFYPGCVARGAAPELYKSTMMVVDKLGIELEEIEKAACTGAGVLQEKNQKLGDVLNIRTLALAEQMGLGIMTICSTCQGVISQANHRVVKDQEAVVNIAALPFIPDSYFYPGDFFSVNTIGSVNMLWKSIKSNTTNLFIHISTSEVYGSAQTVPMNENHPTAPHSTYAVSKLAADRAAFTLHKENGFPVVVIRPFNSFGPRFTEPYIIPEIMNQILRGNKELTLGNIHSSRDFTFVKDTADGILRCLQEKKAIGEIINIRI